MTSRHFSYKNTIISILHQIWICNQLYSDDKIQYSILDSILFSKNGINLNPGAT
ncbi:hypothetical protein DDB_G0275037 [Dictyostelium discoideum AX4]|uniref:Uncharacterized protein n=1 Tax=Dictyostelium discoideum TaxID=44689 RepID=Q86I64_DICDI|nr:hypothetical protein DDB_G0275037 [Dictyostelium discoideum AX4]EAL69799.1 hypothetical protein DDB_G0275037 [Dictyostelium discoideum AX4]|eukprot:XP_643847.1 hypothetical protein DDB_G0275037 [Dictyostelium discoideum AX4]